MKIQHRDYPFEIRAVEDDGSFAGYLSVFDEVDAYGTATKQGAFKKTIAKFRKDKRGVPILWQHNTDQPIGPFTSLTEDATGLLVEGKLLVDDIAQAREAHALLRNRVISGLSMGFVPVTTRDNKDTKVRELLEVDLWEGSLVTFPANDSARVTDVRAALLSGALPDLKSFEEYLREAGFSRKQATAIAGRGLAHLLRSESGAQPAVASRAQCNDVVAALRRDFETLLKGAL